MARPLLLFRRVRNHRQIVAAGLGGIVGSVLDVITLVLLVEGGMAVAAAAFFGAAAGAGAAFLANKYWAFRDPRPLCIRQVTRFGLVSFGTACLMAALMAIVAGVMDVPYLQAKAICAALVFVVWTFPAQRRFVFRSLAVPAGDPARSAA